MQGIIKLLSNMKNAFFIVPYLRHFAYLISNDDLPDGRKRYAGQTLSPVQRITEALTITRRRPRIPYGNLPALWATVLVTNLIPVFISLLVFIFISCEAPNLDCPSQNLRSLSTFDSLGILHNSFLTNIKDDFDEEGYSSSLTYVQKVDVIRDFHLVYANNTLSLSSEDSLLFLEYMEKFKHLVNLDSVYSKIFVESSVYGQTVEEALVGLKNDHIIDEFEYDLVVDLPDLVLQNYSGTIGVQELRAEITDLRTAWNNHGYTECDSTGWFSAAILAVSLHSVQWWIDNPDQGVQERVAPWVAVDAGGAVYGAIVSTITIVGTSNGHDILSWENVGKFAIGVGLGALGASTGIAGKIGRFLFG